MFEFNDIEDTSQSYYSSDEDIDSIPPPCKPNPVSYKSERMIIYSILKYLIDRVNSLEK